MVFSESLTPRVELRLLVFIMRVLSRSGNSLFLSLLLSGTACEPSSNELLDSDEMNSGGDGDPARDSGEGGDGDTGGGGKEPGGVGGSEGTGDPGSLDFPQEQCSFDLAAQFEMVEFSVPVNAQQDRATPVVVTPDNDGGLWLAWTDSPYSEGVLHAHIRHLNADLEMDGTSLDIPDSVVVGMYAHADGSLAVAHGRRTGPEPSDPSWAGSPGGPAPNTLFLSRYLGSDEVFTTQIRGGEGYTSDPESTWFLSDYTGAGVSVSFDGSRYGVFFVIGRFFEDESVHQADEYVEISPEGIVAEASRQSWINSHSFWPSSVAVESTIYTLTTADPFPVWGVRLGSYPAQGEPNHVTIWPTPDIVDQVTVSGPVARQGAIFEVGGRLAVTSRTWVDKDDPTVRGDTEYAAFHSFETDGSPVAFTPLAAEVTSGNDLAVLGARFGSDALTLVAEGANAGVFGLAPVTAQVLSVEGELLSEPVQLDARLSWASDPVTLADGSVVWPAVKDNVSKTVQLARVGCK